MESASTRRRHRRAAATVATFVTGLFAVVFAVQQSLSAVSAVAPDTGIRPPSTVETAADGRIDAADGWIASGQRLTVSDAAPAVARLDPALLAALRKAAEDAAAHGVELRINGGWRSAELQDKLLRDAEATYGSPEEAARWVATADTSEHVTGDAVDVGPWEAADWLGRHGDGYGLCRVYENEPWHFELRPDAAREGCPPMYRDPTQRER